MIFCRLYLPVLLGLFSVVLYTGHRENSFARQRSCAAARRGSISGMESGLRDLVRGDTGVGKGPLYNAALGGHYEAVQWLLDLKKRLALDRLFLGEDAALCAAAEGGHLEICCLLLEHGAEGIPEVLLRSAG